MRRVFFSTLGVLYLSFMVAVPSSCGKPPGETVNDPYISVPNDYDDPSNATKKYPLFVYLHGSGSPGGVAALPCLVKEREREDYPCLIFVPHTKTRFDNDAIITQIEKMEKSYRIDADRMYLTGYSLGGSGSYSLANRFFQSKGRLFAAIIRLSGQSETTLETGIVEKTSVWYHVGLADLPLRVKVALDAFAFLKHHATNATATETSAPVSLSSHPGTTFTLNKSGRETVKYTEYESPTGHGIGNFPFEDPYLLKWLFSQTLEGR